MSLPDADANVSSIKKDLLEKKWTSVVRLKKQVMELEKQAKQIKEEALCERCDGMTQLSSFGGRSQIGDGLPREPAKFTLQGHRSRITKVVVHPFYNLVASASEDATIRLWDFEQGEAERTLKSHAGIVTFLDFNTNGNVLASSATDLTIKLWNLETFTVTKTLTGHEHEVSGLAFLPNSDYLLSCSRDQSIRYWDTQSGFCLLTLTHGHSDWIRRISVHHNSKLFASASKDESIVIWNCDMVKSKGAQGRGGGAMDNDDAIVQVLSEHEHVIDCIVWAPTEACRTIEAANYAGGGEEAKEGNEDEAEELNEKMAGSEDTLGAGQGGDDESRANETTRLTTKERIQQMKQNLINRREAHKKGHDLDDEQEEEETKERGNRVAASDAANRAVKDYLASGSRDKTIKIWEVKNARCVITLVGHDNWVTDLAFHPVGRFLLSVSDDKSLRCWDLTSGRCTKKLLNIHNHFVTSVAIK